ncbi:hypothetical protein M0R45_035220 [Rubus argutus]|uniref:ABC-type xenobiotic transporter n=1 Tax=Rubus argutus TaxID=59490 RepID=A0AAW1VWP2_RUBAR
MIWEDKFDLRRAMNLGLEFRKDWLQQNFPCLCEHISIVIQLSFLGILLLHSLQKSMGHICKQRTDFPDKCTEKNGTGTGIRFSTIYKTSTACCLLLMVTHFIVLMQLLNGSVTYCNHKVRTFSSEGMQVVSWAISSVAVYRIVNITSMKFPWLLRAWWLCSFILSIVSVAVDTHFRITYHGQLRLQDYADFLSLIPSTCLFAISIQGKTGLTFTIPNGITEPLLNGKGDQHSEGRQHSPYGKATLLQLITFSWLNPLFAIGVKKPIDQEEIPDVDIKDSAEYLSHSFDESLQHVKERDGTTNPEIYKTMYLFIRKKAAINAMFATGTQLFEDCMLGILREKTTLYVTHQVEFLPAADLILVMQDGKIAQAGSFEELLKQNIGFEVLVGAHNRALESILTVENSSRTTQDPTLDSEPNTDSTSNAELQQTRQESEHNLSLEISEQEGKLVQDEQREKGSIGKQVYWSYLTTVKGGVLIPIIVLAQSSSQVLQVASNYWMAWATPPTIETEPKMGIKFTLLVYILLAVGSSLCVLLRSLLVAVAGLATAQKRFTNMLHSILRAPMAFFDSTPTGRILNRASTDQSVLDLEMANRLGWCAFSIIQILGTIGVMSQVAWEVFVIFLPVTAVCIWYQQYYIPTARELARLSGIQTAPILHHFAESLAGAATIRAFDQQERFSDANLSLIDNHSRPWFHNMSAMEWLSFRLNLLSNFVFAFSLVLLVTLPEGVINPSIAGLAVTYGINLNVLQASIIWNVCNADIKMISVERILQYSNLTSEAPLVIEDSKPPINWPQVGTICFKNLQIRYAEHLPSVLKNISCTFPGQNKVGVVGRTGSGKSTLIQALFRIVEPREGSIIIDGVDICKIGLHDLRSRLSIIPQDPTMFEGTVRGNLDPLEQYSDSDVWEALDKCQLGDLVRAKEEKLEASVVENGENWSAGQRQLVCLGRALLKKSRIMVLDEATASVDSATERVILKIISQEFKDRTVVTIAHRIHTVIDSDLVLVLSDGRIAEYDTPAKLLEREESLFSKLMKEYSMRSQSLNSLANLHN